MESAPAAAFEVYCPCGHAARGVRAPRHQVIRCSACGKAIFILPASPGPGAVPATEAPRPARPRRTLLVALGVLAFSGCVLGGVFLLTRKDAKEPVEDYLSRDLVLARIDRGRQALALGKVHLALREFNEALDATRDDPSALSSTQRRSLTQWQRQADLLSRLSPVLLEEIIQSGKTFRDAEEWRTEFRNHHQGKTVVFDDLMTRDAENRPALATYVVSAGGESARVALEDVTLLRHVTLNGRPRVVFGARLKSCTREGDGRWIVRFEEESGVLLTDKEAAGCLPGGVDEELTRVLKWQAEQLARIVRLAPASR